MVGSGEPWRLCVQEVVTQTRVSERVDCPQNLRPQVILAHYRLPFYRQGSQGSEILSHLPKVTLATKRSALWSSFPA